MRFAVKQTCFLSSHPPSLLRNCESSVCVWSCGHILLGCKARLVASSPPPQGKKPILYNTSVPRWQDHKAPSAKPGSSHLRVDSPAFNKARPHSPSPVSRSNADMKNTWLTQRKYIFLRPISFMKFILQLADLLNTCLSSSDFETIYLFSSDDCAVTSGSIFTSGLGRADLGNEWKHSCLINVAVRLNSARN